MGDFSAEDYLDEIWIKGRELGLPDSDIHRVLTSAIEEKLHNEKIANISESYRGPISPRVNGRRPVLSILFNIVNCLIKITVCFTIVFLSASVVISMHNPTRKFVTRNIQDYIYPVMTRLRSVSLPVLAHYPKLSHWYSEECLIENPFFDQVSGDCSRCVDVTEYETVSDIENFTDVYYNNGKIIIITDAAKYVSLQELLSKIDVRNEENLGTWKVSSKNDFQDMEKEQLLQEYSITKDLHIEWKINRLETLHIVREMFPRLYFIPHDTEVSLHSYMFVDGEEHGPYALPISEFANVALIQADGSSVYNVEPSPHCMNDCLPLNLILNASQVLFFNWIYWRPVRVEGSELSTVILSSFY